jgi:hypothetical protein
LEQLEIKDYILGLGNPEMFDFFAGTTAIDVAEFARNINLGFLQKCCYFLLLISKMSAL